MVKFVSFPSDTYGTIFNPGDGGRIWLQVDNSTGTPVASFGGTGGYGTDRATGTTTLVPGVWYHLVGTYSTSEDFFKIYLNGTLEDTEDTNQYFYLYSSNYWYFGRNYYSSSGGCSSYCYLGGADVDNIQLWEKVLSNGDVKSIYQEPLTGKVLYATQHFGGSDDKTDSEGKLDDLFVITKVYDGSSSGASVNPYIGLRYGDWSKPVVATAI